MPTARRRRNDIVARGLCAHRGKRRPARLDHAGRRGRRPSPRRAPRRAGRSTASPSRSRTTSTSPGLPTTCACPEFAYVPERSATVVERLEQAGAILIGKTNLDQFATGLERHPLALRHPGEHVQPRLHLRRIELGLGGGRRGGPRVVRARHRHGGIGARAGGLQQHRRAEADQGPDQHARRGAGLPDARYRLDLCADRRRCRAKSPRSRSPSTRKILSRDADAPRFAVEAAPRPLRVGVPQRTDPVLRRSRTTRRSISARSTGWRRSAPRSSPSTSRRSRKAAAMLYAGPWVAERLAAIGDLADARSRRDPRGRARHHPRRARARRRSTTFEAFYDLAELHPRGESGMGEDGRAAAADRGHDLHDRRDARRSRRAQLQPRRLYELRQSDGPCGARRAGGLPRRRHSVRRDAHRPALSDGMLAVSRRRAAPRRSTGAKLGATSISLCHRRRLSRVARRSRRRPSRSRSSARISPASRSTASSSSATRSSSRRRAPRPAIASMRLPTRRRRSPASCSTARAPAASRSRSGRWTRRPSARSWRSSRRRSASAR